MLSHRNFASMEMAFLDAASVIGPPEITWKKILLLVSSLWFCLVASLLSARLLLGRALRTSREEEQIHRRSSIPLPDSSAAGEQHATRLQISPPTSSRDENLSPDLHFRFSFLIPQPVQKMNSEHQSSTVSSTSRYRFVSERSSEGFLQAPMAATMFVKESFVESDSDLDGYAVTDQKLDYRSGGFSDSDLEEDTSVDSSSWDSEREEISCPNPISSRENDTAPVSCSSEINDNGGEDLQEDGGEMRVVCRIGEDDAALSSSCPNSSSSSEISGNGGEDLQEDDGKMPVFCKIGEDDAAPASCFPNPSGSSEISGNVDEDLLEKDGEDDAALTRAPELRDEDLVNDRSPTSFCPNPTKSAENYDYQDRDLQTDDGRFLGEDISGELGHKWEDLHLEEMEEDLEDLWESDDVIDQLKMEIRKARSARALPTIDEDSSEVSLKLPMLSYLPLREDPILALRKLHKGYRERMKKLDVLNYQKISATGLLQLKNTEESGGGGGKFWRHHRRCGDGASERMMKEIERDLEMVYVGQLSLSWEFLHWQYQRTRELAGSGGSYDRVAGEFQQFQVLVQRFVEDEPFQGPRVVNYTRSRRRLRGLLLQVPLFREDGQKKKKEEKEQGGISIEELEYIMEDSIRLFWDFIRAEKNSAPTIIKSLLSSPVHLQDPADHDLAIKVQSLLKQKQKKLKEELRAGTWLVRRLRKSRERKSNEDDIFFAQVDVKLVERVLAMASVTGEQLSWCLRKMKKIHSVERKLFREPSFLLFPC